MTVPPELQQREWVAIRSWNDARIARTLGTRTRVGSLREALALAAGRPVMALRDGQVFVFGSGLDPASLSEAWGEACGFSIHTKAQAFRCVRCRDGEIVREIARIGTRPMFSGGTPGRKRDPALETVDGETVLALAAAWYCDPVPALSEEAWILEPLRSRRKQSASAFRPPERLSPWLWVGLGAALLSVVFLWVNGGPDRDAPVDRVLGHAPCTLQTTCKTCSVCAMTNPDHPCAARVADCAADPYCMQLWTCLDGCGAANREALRQLEDAGPGTSVPLYLGCADQCREAYPDGVERFRSWDHCVRRDACAAVCTPID